jgi:hypothetical protein
MCENEILKLGEPVLVSGPHHIIFSQKGDAKMKKGNAFTSHKYTGRSTLRHELGVDILAGRLV